MQNYQEGKKVRRIAAVVYILIITIIVGMTYYSQQQHEQENEVFEDVRSIVETRDILTPTQTQD